MFLQLISHMAAASFALFLYRVLEQYDNSKTITEDCEEMSKLGQVPELIQASGRESWDDEDSSTCSRLSEEEEDDDDSDGETEDEEGSLADKAQSITDNEPEVDVLSQLVDKDAEDVELVQITEEQTRLITQLIKMRRSLEQFLDEELAKIGENRHCRNKSLCRDINTLRDDTRGAFDKDFLDAMHTLRYHGNAAVHARFQDLPSYEECTHAVRNYMELKHKHKQKYAAKC